MDHIHVLPPVILTHKPVHSCCCRAEGGSPVPAVDSDVGRGADAPEAFRQESGKPLQCSLVSPGAHTALPNPSARTQKD